MNAISKRNESPVWATRWLAAAGIYNLLWGAATIAFPHFLFDVSGIDRLNYPEIWQCVGMIVGAYGIGYLIAAGDSRTHWPIVLVGLLGKVFGPIGFVVALLRGTFPPLFGLTILNASPEVVFGFHESPDALRHLIPPWEKMEVVESSESLQIGSRVVLGGRVLGLVPIRWVAVHTEYEPPHLFADRQESGPFAWWYHRHRILDDGQGGTVLRDEIEYQTPLGLIGHWLGGWLVRRKLEAMFAYRHETTRRLIESEEWTGADVRTMTHGGATEVVLEDRS